MRSLFFSLFFFVYCFFPVYDAVGIVFASSDTISLIKQNIREGSDCYKRSNFVCASERYFNALRLAEKINDSLHIALSSNNIAIIYHETDKLNESKKYSLKAIAILEKMNLPGDLGDAYNTLGNAYYSNYEDSMSVVYYLKAIKQWEIANDSLGLFTGYKNLGAIYIEMGKPETGLPIMEQCIHYLRAKDDTAKWFSAYMTLGEAFVYNRQLEKGKMYLDIAEKFLPSVKAYYKIDDYHYALYYYYKKKNDFQNALKHHELYKQFSDSVINIEKGKQLLELNTQYETEKKEAQISFQEQKIKQEQKARKLSVTAAAVVILLLLALLVIYRQRQQQKTEQLLQQQHEKNVQEIFHAEQNERIRIARDLHDSIGQKLSVIRMLLPIQDVNTNMQKIASYLDETAAEVRAISHSLIPEILNLGLIKAMENLAEQIKNTNNIHVQFIADKNLQKLSLSKQTELSLYRIVQEILSNIIRHSKTETLDIELKATEDFVQILIEDKGVGFDTENINETKGIGWKNIFARIKLINGNIQIRSEKNKGSHFLINIPVA